MSTQAYKDAVELAVDRWNAHDERYFEAYTEDASMHGFLRACLQPSRNRGAVRGDVAAFPDIRGDDLPALRLGGEDRRALEPAGRGGPDDSAGADAGLGYQGSYRDLRKTRGWAGEVSNVPWK